MKALAAIAMLLPMCLSAAVFAGGKAEMKAIANVSAIAPGRPFVIGLKLTIAPGWHVYWNNPGDSGLPTEVKLNLPAGFSAGQILFPVPTRLQLPGDIVNYAYENEVMLMVRITPPKDLPAGSKVTVGGEASWLVCQDECVPGKAEWSVELPVAGSAVSANAELFQRWQGQLPVKEDPADIAALSHTVSVANGKGSATIDVRWKKLPGDVQYFPGALQEGDVSNIKVQPKGDSTRITFSLANYLDHEPVNGLLVFTSPTGVRTGVEISIPCGGDGPAN
jgi:DsbC/DsbD-like thiol-disulfide interchange protein